jgi:hypothetical protein
MADGDDAVTKGAVFVQNFVNWRTAKKDRKTGGGGKEQINKRGRKEGQKLGKI